MFAFKWQALPVQNLADCHKLGDAALATLSGNTTLKELTLPGCEALTDAALESIKTFRALAYLDISNCAGISDEAVRALRKALPDCEIVH